jgi:hypothetical protein
MKELLAEPLRYVHEFSTNMVESIHSVEHKFANKRLHHTASYAGRAALGIGVHELGYAVRRVFILSFLFCRARHATSSNHLH